MVIIIIIKFVGSSGSLDIIYIKERKERKGWGRKGRKEARKKGGKKGRREIPQCPTENKVESQKHLWKLKEFTHLL